MGWTVHASNPRGSKVFSGLWTILIVLCSPNPNCKNSRKQSFELHSKNLHLNVTKNQKLRVHWLIPLTSLLFILSCKQTYMFRCLWILTLCCSVGKLQVSMTDKLVLLLTVFCLYFQTKLLGKIETWGMQLSIGSCCFYHTLQYRVTIHTWKLTHNIVQWNPYLSFFYILLSHNCWFPALIIIYLRSLQKRWTEVLLHYFL